jgi:uncharacterized protein (DUF1015 family)
MPEIIPFRGILYNQSRVPLADVVAPPYDVISAEQQAALYEANPYNVVRLILGKEEDRYTSAAEYFQRWLKEGILVRNEKPCFYLLHQTFDDREGRTLTRKGFIALCRLEEFERRVVLPHEKTLAGPREDRLKLFRATNANFDQVFTLYSDPRKELDQLLNGNATTPPVLDVLFDDVQNRVWRIQDEPTIRAIQAFLSERQVLIADGHHRYETALAYRNERRAANPHHTGNELYNYVMMFFTNIDDDSLVIYPTHRLVHSLNGFDRSSLLALLGEYFIVREFREYEDVAEGMKSSSATAFGIALHGDPFLYLATLKPAYTAQELVTDPMPEEVKQLDVSLLHSFILKRLLGISVEAQERKTNIDYVKDARQAVANVQAGQAQIAFLLNPTHIAQVRAVAKSGHTMPQKSTYFYPKLASGLVLHTLAD